MDHLEVLRDKIARLRAEIANIQTLNQAYRSRDWDGPDAQTMMSKDRSGSKPYSRSLSNSLVLAARFSQLKK
jgi:hypothetical protein